MRTRIKKVKDPMIIRAEFDGYHLSVRLEKFLRIKISTDIVRTSLILNNKKTITEQKRIYDYSQKSVWTTFRRIKCRCNRHTRYKDFLYLLRNPHTAIVFLNSDNHQLKTLAEEIIKGKKIIFPRETRYRGI